MGTRSDADNLLTYSGALMNWLGDYLTDPNIRWVKKNIPIHTLYLTGTNPKWNKIIIAQAKRSPKMLHRVLLLPKVQHMFKSIKNDGTPILVRYDEGKYKVLDGMHRVIGAIRDDKEKIAAYIAYQKGKARPMCEPHVVYDLLRAYQRKLNTDKKSLIAALRFLKKSYSNVEELLRKRFNASWLPDPKLQAIIQEVLKN